MEVSGCAIDFREAIVYSPVFQHPRFTFALILRTLNSRRREASDRLVRRGLNFCVKDKSAGCIIFGPFNA